MSDERLERELEEILGDEDSCGPIESDVWTSEVTKLLIETRLSMESQFIKGEKSKNTLWNNIIIRMKRTKPQLNLTGKEARTKFNNMMLTYKRNKKRKNQSGAAPINWQYFDRFDEIYGSRHSIQAPESSTIDTLQDATNHSQDINHFEEMNNDGFQEDTPSRSKKRKKSSQHEDLISYWKQEDENEQTRHNERIKIENERNVIEQNKVQVLLEIKDVLLKLID